MRARLIIFLLLAAISAMPAAGQAERTLNAVITRGVVLYCFEKYHALSL